MLMPATADAVALADITRSPGYWATVWRRFRRDPVAVAARCWSSWLIVLVAIFAPYIAPHDPYRGMTCAACARSARRAIRSAPTSSAATCSSRLIYGARLSLFMGVTPVILAFVIGSMIGIVAGYVGGWVNTMLMRTIDVFFAFPSVLLAIALSGALGAGIVNSLVSLTIVFIPPIARVAESVTTSVRIARLRRGRARLRRRRLHHHARARARQRAGPDLRLRHEPDRRVDDPGLGPLVPRARRQAARARMGPDAQHAAHRDLHAAAGVRAARA